MQGTLAGTDAWFKNPVAQTSAHFGVGKNGKLLQWLDTDDKAWAIVSGNRQWVSLECEGRVPDALTPAQIAVAGELLAWLHATDGVPLQTTDDPLDGRGLGWHGMGGEAWGHPDCPGSNVVAQRDAIVAAASSTQAVGGGAGPPPAVLNAFRDAHPALQSGSKGSAVAHLRALLFVPAGLDFDAGLGAIVESFQEAAGIQVDGIVGAETWSHLHPLIELNDTGAVVTEVQHALGIAADGTFGADTERAVEALQRASGLRPDGIVGPDTYGVMLGIG